MAFFGEVWKGVRRLFARKCPQCGVSDADLPEPEKARVRLVHQERRWQLVGKSMKRPWIITEEFRCTKCGRIWAATRWDLNGPSRASTLWPTSPAAEAAARRAPPTEVKIVFRSRWFSHLLPDAYANYKLFLDSQYLGDVTCAQGASFHRQVPVGPHELIIQRVGAVVD